MDIISLITDPDDKTAYENTKRIASESEFSDKYYSSIPEFVSLLDDKKSYIRTRAMILCCSQSRWDSDGQLKKHLPKMLQLIHDEKPTVVRQSLNALKEVAVFRPELGEEIMKELNSIDLSGYRGSMAPLISKDIAELKELMETNNEQV